MTQLAVPARSDPGVDVRQRTAHPARHAPGSASAAVRVGGGSAAGRAGVVNIAQLQRIAGNRAVAGLLARPASAPTRGSGSASSTRPATLPDASPVQRLSLTELADRASSAVSGAAGTVASAAASALPAGLVDALTGARQSADAAQAGAERAGDQHAAQAAGDLDRAPQELDGRLQAAGQSTSAAVTTQAAAAEQQGAGLATGADEVHQQGAQAAASLASLTPAAAELVSPATAVVAPGVVAQQDQRINQVAAEVGRPRPAAASAAGGSNAAGSGPAPTPAGSSPTAGPTASGAPTSAGAPGAVPEVASVVGNSIGPAAAPSWNCDLASVISTAGGLQQNAVTAALGLAEQGMGSDRFGQVSRFARSMGQGIDRVVGAVRTKLDAASTAARSSLADLGRSVTAPATAAVAAVRRGFDAVTRTALSAVADLRRGASEKLSGIAQGASKAVSAVGDGVRQTLTDAAGTARRLLGRLGTALLPLLPSWARTFAEGLPARVAAATAALAAARARVTAAASRAATAVTAGVKRFMDAKLREWAAQRQAAEAALRKVSEVAGRAGRAVVAAIPESVKGPVTRLVSAGQAQADRILAAGDAVGGQLRDGACVVTGAVAGPCVTQHLPSLGDGLSNTVRVVAQGDLTVPLEEIGVPANLKIGAGSTVSITANSATYTVKVVGDATVFLNETVGSEEHAEAGATAAPQLTGSMAAAWQALGASGATGAGTGGGGPSATPAPAPSASSAGGSVPAAAGGTGAGGGMPAGPAAGVGADAGRKVEVNGGIRGSTESEWHFDAAAARTSCDGVGGLVTLLSGLGVAQVLPAPFNSFGPAAVQRGFMRQLTASRFSAGLGGEIKVDLVAGGLGQLRGRLGGDISENLQTVRDPVTGELVTTRSRTLTGELDATALGPFTAAGLEQFRIFLQGQGILRLTLAYEGDDIVPTSLGAAIKTTVGARNFDPALVAGLFPPEVAADVRRLLTGLFPGMEGPREVALALTIGRVYSGLEPMGRELNTYFRGPIDAITVDGVIDIVKRNLAAVTPANHAKLELSATQRANLAAGAVEGEGVAAGGNASLQAEHVISREWYGFGGTDEVLEAAAAQRGRAAGERVEPKDRKEPGPGSFRMRSQVQEKTAAGADLHWGSASVTAADSSKGVTAFEFEETQAAAKQAALDNEFPRGRVQALDTAKAAQSQTIRTVTIPAGGVPATRVGDINELRKCFDTETLNPAVCGGRGQVRLDVENLEGHNLRFPR